MTLKTFIALMMMASMLPIAGCAGKDKNTAGAETVDSSRSFVTKSYVTEKRSEDFPGMAAGAYVKVSYDLVDGPADPVHDSVNVFILRFVKTSLARAQGDATGEDATEVLIKKFMEKYDAFRKENKGVASGWEYTSECKFSQPYRELICVTCTEAAYTGGPNATSGAIYRNFYLADGKPATLENVFSYPDSLRNLAETNFRNQQKIPAGTPVNEAGYTFPGGKFTLTENFTFRNDSIVFCYNRNDIAQERTGPIQLSMSMYDVRKLLQVTLTP